MKQKPANTIVDIARALGVSASTVSRALKDHPYISQATKDKVKKMAAKLGYRRNTLAAGLRNRRSNTIGLIVPRISMYFQSTVITAIQHAIHASGYYLIVCQSNDNYALEVELANALYDSRVEGLIVSTTMYTTDFSHFDIFSKNQIPLVFYDRVPRNYPAQVIRGDDYHGGYLVGRHLLEQGCRHIAVLNGVLTCNLYQDRLAGFRAAMKEGGVRLKKSWTFSHELTAENAEKTCRKIFSQKPYPDAVFAMNDTSAITVHQQASALGLRIPEDLRIVGYSNDPRAAIITPAITSVEQFPAEVGARAAQALTDLISRKSPLHKPPPEIITPIKLVERASG